MEAVFEDPKIKAEITQEVEGIIPKNCIFASNTSTLPITDLAKASSQPNQFIGIHFFSPVEKMRLVEIIRGKETNNTAVAKALDFVRQIKENAHCCKRCKVFLCKQMYYPLHQRRH